MWNAPTEEGEKIIALEAQVRELTSKATKAKQGATKKSYEGNRKKNKGKFKKDDRYSRNPWMIVPPNAGDPLTKEVNGKEFIFCPKHQAWGGHTAIDCRGTGLRGKDPEVLKKVHAGGELRLARALAALAEEADYESGGDEDQE